mmetsp:Transcript_26679/g.47376  ORF Transcript_26679/g.47376 Transcript_26679/m.47376 type:complete len:210 (-) Transcript_26679:155-784(-)
MQSLVGDLECQPLVWVHGPQLGLGDAEEVPVELVDARDEVPQLDVGLAGRIHVGVEVRIHVPTLWRQLVGGVEAQAHVVPVLVHVVRKGARVASGVAGDGQHGAAAAERRTAESAAAERVVVGRTHLGENEVHQVRHRRVVEHERRRKLQAFEGSLEPVSELHACQRIQAHLHQRDGQVQVACSVEDILKDAHDDALDVVRGHGCPSDR